MERNPLVEWAWGFKTKRNNRIVLICLADFANVESKAVLSVELISARCKLSMSRTKTALMNLQDCGAIAIQSMEYLRNTDEAGVYFLKGRK